MTSDRRLSKADKRPVDNIGILCSGSDIEEPAEEKRRDRDHGDNRKKSNGSEEFHHMAGSS
jgi:hypothetical protein